MQNLEVALRDLRWEFEKNVTNYNYLDKLPLEHKLQGIDVKMAEVDALAARVGEVEKLAARVGKVDLGGEGRGTGKVGGEGREGGKTGDAGREAGKAVVAHITSSLRPRTLVAEGRVH